MQASLGEAAAGADVVVMAAAVADFRPSARASGKLSRRQAAGSGRKGGGGDALVLSLTANPDLLAELGRRRRGERPLLVGFAAEIGATGDALVARARAKLAEKGCDVIVANDVSAPGLGFDSDSNAVVLVQADGPPRPLGPAPKSVLAGQIWAALLPRLPPAAGDDKGHDNVRRLGVARRRASR
jgi:phosphopantothenoylcysteine decarboxylase/phosphopantothenate--cysteine ligase